LVLPAGWKSDPAKLNLKVPAQGASAGTVEITVPANWSGPYERRAIAADVMADGRYLGQIAEAAVEVRSAHWP
jgi:hypothetical protein